MELSVSSCAKYLANQNDFLILTHKNPDGDTIGSASALCRGLRALGKTAFVYTNPGFTPRYAQFLDGLCISEFSAGCVIAVDIADIALLPSNAAEYSDKINLAIDHHATHKAFAESILLDAKAAACGEIIYKLIAELGDILSTDIATALYVALSTDTGCFLHSSTTPESHRIAAQLISAGVDIAPLHREFFVLKTRARLAIEAELIRGASFYFGGKCALMRLSRELMEKTQATEDDLDNISALGRSIQGVELGVLIREMSGGKCKISMRSSQAVNAAELCSRFSGGGHPCAAGCTIEGDCDTAEKLICEEISASKIFNATE